MIPRKATTTDGAEIESQGEMFRRTPIKAMHRMSGTQPCLRFGCFTRPLIGDLGR